MPPDPSLVYAAQGGTATGNSPVAGGDVDVQGRLWAEALKRRYPGKRRGSLDIKACAAGFGVSLKTAEGWASGQAPLRRHLVAGWRLHGWSFLAEVLGDPLPTQGDIKDQLAEARADLRRLDRLFARIGGGGGHE